MQRRRMRIYSKLHFIHFKEKRWLFKDVEHQTGCAFNPSPLTVGSLPNAPGDFHKEHSFALHTGITMKFVSQQTLYKRAWREKKNPCSWACTHCFGLSHQVKPLSGLYLHKGTEGCRHPSTHTPRCWVHQGHLHMARDSHPAAPPASAASQTPSWGDLAKIAPSRDLF